MQPEPLGLSAMQAGILETRKTLPEREMEREEEEATRRAKELQEEDRSIAQRMAVLGLVVRPRQLIASEVKVYTPEEIAAFVKERVQQGNHEGEHREQRAAGFFWDGFQRRTARNGAQPTRR